MHTSHWQERLHRLLGLLVSIGYCWPLNLKHQTCLILVDLKRLGKASSFKTACRRSHTSPRSLCTFRSFCRTFHQGRIFFFRPFATACIIFIRWSCNTVLAAIGWRKREGTAVEVNNCGVSVSEWGSAVMEQVALLVAMAAGQSLYGDGMQLWRWRCWHWRLKVWKSFLPLWGKKPWPRFQRIADSSTAKTFCKEDGSSEGCLGDFLLWNLCGRFLLVKRDD